MAPPRKFDWDEAARLRESGMTYAAIGRALGVSDYAVARAVDPARRATVDARVLQYTKDHDCRPCKGGCGRSVWMNGTAGRARSGLCPACSGLARSRTARDGELLCSRCETWQPDEAFHERAESKARRGRHTYCRPCMTAARRDYRNRHKVPCRECGSPRLPLSEKGRGRADTGLCFGCYQASRKASA